MKLPAHTDMRTLEAEAERETDEGRALIGSLVLVAVTGGALTGLVGGCFRIVLREAARWRGDLVVEVRPLGLVGFLVPMVLVGSCAALARWLVRLAPEAGGSGVQRLEAVMRGQEEPPRARVLPAKFVGGILSLGSGMVLGREGPTVQMGATIGDWLAKRTRLSVVDLRRVQAATAGAGLGVAFNAPIGGAVFTFEEVARSVALRLTVATLLACSSAIGVAWLIVGRSPVFKVAAPAVPSLRMVAPVLIFGVLLGGLGVIYNRLVVTFLDLAARFSRVPPEARAACIGAVVGLILRLQSNLVGGGEVLNQHILTGSEPLLALAGIIALRSLLGPFAYAAGTPGGLFAPLLLIGAACGTLFAGLIDQVWPAVGLDPVAFGIVGMSTLFAAVVRAPLTGLLLIVEMTATTSQAIPMLAAAATAIAVAGLLGGQPIYDTLRLRMLRNATRLPREVTTAEPKNRSQRERSGGQPVPDVLDRCGSPPADPIEDIRGLDSGFDDFHNRGVVSPEP